PRRPVICPTIRKWKRLIRARQQTKDHKIITYRRPRNQKSYIKASRRARTDNQRPDKGSQTMRWQPTRGTIPCRPGNILAMNGRYYWKSARSAGLAGYIT